MNESPFPFERFMDAPAMGAEFLRRLPPFAAGGWDLLDCALQHPRYKTYLNPASRDKAFLAAAYHLRLANRATGKEETHILYAKAFLGERAEAEYRSVKEAAGTEPGSSPWFLEDLGMFGWCFPYDPALPWLPRLMDPAIMARRLSDLPEVKLRMGDGGIGAIAIEVVNYRPEIRCTARYRLEPASHGSSMTVYGKSFSDGRGDEIRRRIEALSLGLQRSRDFAVAPVLGYDKETNVLWLKELDSRPLLDCAGEVYFPELLETLGKSLADLHGQRLHGLIAVDAEEQWADLTKKATKLAKEFPARRSDVNALLADLEHHRPDPASQPQALLHGDFHIQQLRLLGNGRLALFDFDELAVGDPVQDLANFAADLHGIFLGDPRPRDWIARLFAGYATAAPKYGNPARFRWHLQGQLLTRAYRAALQRKPDLETRLEHLLHLALDPAPAAESIAERRSNHG